MLAPALWYTGAAPALQRATYSNPTRQRPHPPAAPACRPADAAPQVSVPSSGSAEVQALRAALEANRALQARLQRLLRSTNRAIDRNADLVARVRTLDTKKETAAVGLPGARAQAAAVSGGQRIKKKKRLCLGPRGGQAAICGA